MLHTTLSSAWSHRRRLVSTTFAIVLGVAFLSATLVIRDSATAGFGAAFTEANAGISAMVRNANNLTTSDEPRTPIAASLRSRVAAVDGVAAVAPQVVGPAQLIGRNGKPLGGDGPPTIGTNWVSDARLTRYRVSQGRAPTTAGEVIIDAHSARDGDLRVGSRTTVLTPDPVPVSVVGVAKFGDADSLGGTTLVAFTLPEAQRLFLGDGSQVTNIAVAARPGVTSSELVQRIERVLPAGTEAITGAALTAEQQAAIQGDFLGFFTTALLAFAIIALLVAAFSIFNTFSVLAAQRTRESALLRAIGASRAQVLFAGLVEAVLVAAAGSLIGMAGGVAIARGLQQLLGSEGLGLPMDGLIISGSTVAIAVVTGVGVTIGSATLPALRSSRIPPIAALRETSVDDVHGSLWRAVVGVLALAGGGALVATATHGDAAMSKAALGALVMVVALVLLGPVVAPVAATVLGAPLRWRGVTGDLARSNARRNPRRTAGTAAALLVGVSVVSLFTVFGSSVKASMNSALDRGFTGDLVIEPHGGGSVGLSPSLAPQLAQLPEVGSVAALRFPRIRVDGSPTDVTSTDLALLGKVATFDVDDGSAKHLAVGAFGASTKMANARGWRVGEHIDAQFPDGHNEPLTLAFTYGDRSLLSDVVVPSAIADHHGAQQSIALVLVKFADRTDAAAARHAITAVTTHLGRPNVQDRGEFLAAQGTQIDGLLRIIYALLGVAILIAGMGIANTLSLSIHERTRELGLLRAVGQSRRQVRAMVRWESVIVAIFGTVGGVGLGVFLGWGMIRALAASEGLGTFALPVVPLSIIVALGAGLGVVASVRPALRASRLDVLGAIAGD